MTALGGVQTVVVCVPASTGIQGICPDGQAQSVTQAYLVAASEAQRFELMSAPFDASQAGAFFGFSFASTMFIWLFSLGIGQIMKMVRTA